MSTSILIIAHAPLAHALRECALHVFSDCGDSVAALDVQPHAAPEDSLAQARSLLQQMGTHSTLVLTDLPDLQACHTSLQRLLELIAQPYELSGVQLQISASIGVALYPHD